MKGIETVLYGTSNCMDIIDKIISDFKLFKYSFDVKLILTEALTNAFKYGNDKDSSKPIYLKCFHENKYLQFEIEDCGKCEKKISIDDCCCENIFKDSGRGLFLIKSLSDKVEFKGNTLIIKKACSL